MNLLHEYYLGMRASEIRKQRGLSQGQLADMVGVEQPTISRFERGFDGVTLRLVHQIAQALDVTVADLFGDDRSEAEAALLLAFRSLSDDRQKGWLDMAKATQADQD